MFYESTQFLHNMLFSSTFHLGHLRIIVSVVTTSCNMLQSSSNQMPCIISPSVLACCLLYFPKVLNLAFRNQHPVNPGDSLMSATWGLLRTAAYCRVVGSKLCLRWPTWNEPDCVELFNYAQLKQFAVKVHLLGSFTWPQISNIIQY